MASLLDVAISAIAGAATGIGGSILNAWRTQGVQQEQIRNIRSAHDSEIRSLRELVTLQNQQLSNQVTIQERTQDERVQELRTSLREHIENNNATQGAIVKDLKEAVVGLQGAITEIRVMTREQAVVNKITETALKGIVDRQEAHATQLAQQTENLRNLNREVRDIRSK